MLISITNGRFQYTDKVILQDLNLSVDQSDKIGIIGGNGAGKTTLLSVLRGELSLFSGDIAKKSRLVVGFLPQNATLSSEKTVFDVLKDVFLPLREQIERYDSLTHQLAKATEGTSEFAGIARQMENATSQIEAMGGYNYEYKVESMLRGLGFTDFLQTADTLSGGEQTRLLLGKLLLADCDMLILDEPTNHLDSDTLLFLEDYLSAYKNALLVVSHDRYFLDNVTSKTWEVEDAKVSVFPGNYSRYKVLKEEKFQRELALFEAQQEEIAKLEDYIAKNAVRASTAKSAKSRKNTLDNMEILKRPKRGKVPRFGFSFIKDSVKETLKVANHKIAVADKVLAENVNLDVFFGEKVAIVGKNGVGKSTFLGQIVSAYGKGILERDGLSVEFGKHTKLAYFSQKTENLRGDLTVWEQMWEEFPKATPEELFESLARMLIFEEDTKKKISSLSGGEKCKLSLAVVAGEEANFLCLDEPTNHLDLSAREGLEKALCDFSGTMLFVSHDRYFVQAIATKVFAITPFGGILYSSFEEYSKDIAKKYAEAKAGSSGDTAEKAEVKERPKNVKLQSKQRAKARVSVAQIEKDIAVLEGEIAGLEEEMYLEKALKDHVYAGEIAKKHSEKEEALVNLLARWEEEMELL